MPINDIRLQNFRSYSDETFEFKEGVNIIVGPNASGKTNLLEAIELVCTGKSHRGKDIELISFDKLWCRTDINIETKPRTVKIERQETGPQKSFIVDNQPLKKLSYDKKIPVTLFEPNHLQMLVGRPELRRNYLDELISQSTPGFSTVMGKYKRTLAQRNALLKKGLPSAKGQVFSWDIRLSQLAGEIVHKRQQLIGKINQEAPELYKKLSKSKLLIDIEYVSTTKLKNYESNLLKELENSLALDCLRGFTGRGPHRDDFKIRMGNHAAEEVASRGEARTTLLALKIIEVSIIEKARNQKPVLLLDDVFSELDGARRRALTKFLKNYQTFITTTDADVVVQHFMGEANILPLAKNH